MPTSWTLVLLMAFSFLKKLGILSFAASGPLHLLFVPPGTLLLPGLQLVECAFPTISATSPLPWNLP